MARTNRRTIAVVAGFALGAGFAGAACVIADPPAQIPVPPLTRPDILHEQVVPSVTSILETWPLEFIVPIYVPDPSSPVDWHAFVDYDPVLRTSTLYEPGEIDPDPAGDDGGIRVLSVRLTTPADLNACHTVEILVALTFVEDHTPDSIGGDSVTWFYSPTGNLADCPVYDAGPYDASVDAFEASAAGEGGDDGGVE